MSFSVLFRSDGNSAIGYGHTMRMLALADIISENFEICFITKVTSDWLLKKITMKYKLLQIPPDVTIENEPDYLTTHMPSNSALMIIDGYDFDYNYQDLIHQKCKIKVVCIDDYQNNRYAADVVINHSGLLKDEVFRKDSETRLLLGPQYALLRNEFNTAAKKQGKEIIKKDIAFLCLGGSDPNLYQNIVPDLLNKDIKKLIIVVNDLTKFQQYGFNSKKIEVHSNLSAEELINLMSLSDFAILPSSTLCYEYCTVSGGLFVLQTADNQKNIHNFITQSGCGFDYSHFDTIYYSDDVLEQFMSQVRTQKKFFNGQNEALLRKEIFRLVIENMLEIKNATLDDLMFFFELANDEDARENSINKEKILLENHKEWYIRKLKSPDSALYVLWLESTPLGIIRFDIEGNHATLSYSVEKQFRGKGLGSILLKSGIKEFIDDFNFIKSINGYIHKNNVGSIKSFLKAGFVIDNDVKKEIKDFMFFTLIV
jgi:spore coat polysaccharide biosynthesis predicted glycosyltransferase SpsG